MKVFIEKIESSEEEKGLFSTYGLSKTTTVPQGVKLSIFS